MVTFIITCDGGSLGNHDKSIVSKGYGSFLITMPKHEKSIVHRMDYGDGVTSSEAEYMALVAALQHIVDSFNSVSANLKRIAVVVRTDSNNMVGQLSKNWKINKPNLRSLAIKASSLMQEFSQVTFDRISGVEMKEIIGH